MNEAVVAELTLELQKLLTGPGYSIFYDKNKHGIYLVWIYNGHPATLHAAIILEETAFNAQFSDNKGNKKYNYEEPESITRLINDTHTRFAVHDFVYGKCTTSMVGQTRSEKCD